MAIELWSPQDLYLQRRDPRMDNFPSYFLDTFFTERHFAVDDEILLKDLPAVDREMAMFVLPTMQGRPSWKEQGESVKAFRTAYIKSKDVVRPVDARTPRVSEIMGAPLSLQERFDIAVQERSERQIRLIRNREAWMAARAFIDGQVQIDYEGDQGAPYPSVTVSFGRDPGHTVTLSSNYWDNASTRILDDIEAWADTMASALYGGYPTNLIVGASVARLFKKNTQVLAELVPSTVRRGAEVDVKTGIVPGVGIHNPIQEIGTLSNNITVWAYRDQVQLGGAMVDILHPKDVLLVAPGATGVRAYGAIYDAVAMREGEALATDIYGRMWTDNGDPGFTWVMHQSAPLPIPLYPNRTLKARVLA